MAKADRAEAQQAGDADAIAADEFADVADLSYEQARDELIAIVAQLEGGQSGLEESMRLWRRGEALAAHCSTWLDGAEAALTGDDAE
jgi:exodeoxyribonuclease VII small subunit